MKKIFILAMMAVSVLPETATAQNDTIWYNDLAVKEIKSEESMTRSIFYSKAKSDYVDFQNDLDCIANFVKSHNDVKITITGYADAATGSATTNAKLAEQRAQKIRQALIDRGVNEAAISTDSKGSTVQPMTENDLNRVVNINAVGYILKKDPVVVKNFKVISIPEPSCAKAGKKNMVFEKPNFKSNSDNIDMENGVMGIADDRGFTLQSANGKFIFKPYLFLQTQGKFNWYDSEGIDKAYNQDNVANSGFAIPYAILGFTGTTFGRIDYNLCINASASGGNVLQQGWIDAKIVDEARFRVGKFKTPFFHAYLTTLGETLFPVMPTSLTSTVIMPYNLNAVNPTIGTGFDLGVEFHGMAHLTKKQYRKETVPGFKKDWMINYEVGLWNGTGSSVNTATKTLSDDAGVPSLLYAGRLTFMPWGKMPKTQGNNHMLRGRHMEFGISGGINVESENESTNDTRVAGEFSMLYNRWYVGVEGYWMHVSYTERQKISQSYNYWGGYAQVGYFFTKALQGGFRWDILDRNGTSTDGFLNTPGVVLNWYINKYNLKLTGMYQYTGRWGHATQLDRDNDDLGIATHSATLQLQYSF